MTGSMTETLHTENLLGVLRYDEPMSSHTSWRVGGPAKYFYTPRDRDDLARFLNQLPNATPIVWVGLGSNLLIRDGGFLGAVICTHKGLSRLEDRGDGEIYAQAGVPCAKVARFCTSAGLAGAVFLAGIPGSMGGALAMNAGAFGGETWDIVKTAETIDHDGKVQVRNADEFNVAYRSVVIPDGEWFTAATLQLEAAPDEDGKQRISELLRQRGASQPIQTANAGSVFRNPEGDYAARLIETAGLKGAREGGAVVSEKHANFIINAGDARAADIERLIQRIQETVLQVHAVELEPEVRLVGEPL